MGHYHPSLLRTTKAKGDMKDSAFLFIPNCLLCSSSPCYHLRTFQQTLAMKFMCTTRACIYIYIHLLATRPIQGVVFWALNFLRKVLAGAVLFKLMCSFRGIWLEDLWILSIDNFLERSLSQFLVHPKMTILRTSTLLSCVREILINLISDIAFDKNWNHFMCRALLEEPKKGKIKKNKKKGEGRRRM